MTALRSGAAQSLGCNMPSTEALSRQTSEFVYRAAAVPHGARAKVSKYVVTVCTCIVSAADAAVGLSSQPLADNRVLQGSGAAVAAKCRTGGLLHSGVACCGSFA